MTATPSNISALRPDVSVQYPIKQQILDFIAGSIDGMIADGVDLQSVAMVFFGHDTSDPKEEQPDLYTHAVGFSSDESLHLDYVYALASCELARVTGR